MMPLPSCKEFVSHESESGDAEEKQEEDIEDIGQSLLDISDCSSDMATLRHIDEKQGTQDSRPPFNEGAKNSSACIFP